jgi:hypothetical protein
MDPLPALLSVSRAGPNVWPNQIDFSGEQSYLFPNRKVIIAAEVPFVYVILELRVYVKPQFDARYSRPCG